MTDPATAHVLIAVTAPTAENATEWATTVSDLVQAEYGDTMRLAVRINPPATAPAAVPSAPADRAAILREAAERVTGHAADHFPDDYDEYADQLADELRRMADEAQQPETQAQPPYHRWYVETRDGVAEQWAPGMRLTERAEAVERYEALNENHPTWKDGTPVERRLVRETTTYTVEQPAAVSQPGKEA